MARGTTGQLLRLLKGVYDLLAAYLLAWVLLFALLAWVFFVLFTQLVGLLGYESIEAFWLTVEQRGTGSAIISRLIAFGLLHCVVFWLVRSRLRGFQVRVERVADALLVRYRRWAKRRPRGRLTLGVTFSVLVTLLLVPFVIQPTMVPLRFDTRAWALRAANLVDGSATAALSESVIGLYRHLFAHPVPTRAVSGDDFDATYGKIRRLPGESFARRPLMDRWDALIAKTVGHDRRAFALVKAFIWVESGGQQFAVSSTGCVGLMQFCMRTARSGGFRRLFGVGQLYPCNCNGVCRVPRGTKRELETASDLEQISRHHSSFPCELTDARFDAAKSIAAGWLYIRRLQEQFAGNINLMYIGYNSGPEVARRVWRAIGESAVAGLSTIAPHLPAAMLPFYGDRAVPRARSLLRVHLPKLQRAFRRYVADARSMGPRVSLSIARAGAR